MKSSSVKCCDGHTYKCGIWTGEWYCCQKCPSKVLEGSIKITEPKSPPFNLKRLKDTAQKAKETFVGKEWALKELGWDEPKYGWTHEKEVLNKLIKLAEQRGYERGLERSSTTSIQANNQKSIS